MEAYLDSKCAPVCRDHQCRDAVKQSPSGRWYITIGHPGFNSSMNNRLGYATEIKARSVVAGRELRSPVKSAKEQNGITLTVKQAQAVAEALRMGEEGLNWAKRMDADDEFVVAQALRIMEAA